MQTSRSRFPLASIAAPRSASGTAVIGYGKSFASFGEVVQGRGTDGRDFLVTLPVDMWSTCEIKCSPINGPLVVDCDLEKSRSVLYHVLAELGVDWGYHLQCQFTRNIPIGKGLSSSTADMLATLRAIQEVFGFLFTEQFISRIFAEIEPHDGLHFNSSVMYDHRSGRLIENYGYIPDFTIIAVDGGGTVDTVHYNRTLSFSPAVMARFDALLMRLRSAYAERDDRRIADCATESAQLHLERTGNLLLKEVLAKCNSFSPMGIIATHSGTCAGFVYGPRADAPDVSKLAAEIAAAFDRSVFVAKTLRLLE